MEEEFELILKSDLRALKEENKKLKEKALSINNFEKLPPQLISEITKILSEESKKERELIIKSLNEIKDLNKSTLDNVITKTESLEFKIEDLIMNLSELIENVSEILKESKFQNKTKKTTELEIPTIETMNLTLAQVNEKMLHIQEFMAKLQLLLSQVKPTDLTLSTNNISKDTISSNINNKPQS